MTAEGATWWRLGNDRRHSAGGRSASDITSYQAGPSKGKWPATHAINVDQHGGFEPGRTFAAFTELPVARNTARLKGWHEGKSSVCS